VRGQAFDRRASACDAALPPYEGEFDEIVPHLTVAHGDPEVLAAAAADVEPALPLAATVRAAFLLEEVEPDWGRWVTRRRLELRR